MLSGLLELAKMSSSLHQNTVGHKTCDTTDLWNVAPALACSWILMSCQPHRVILGWTTKGHLRINRTGSPQDQLHRVSSGSTAQGLLRINRTGPPQDQPHRVTSGSTAQGLLRINCTGSPHDQLHRVTSGSTTQGHLRMSHPKSQHLHLEFPHHSTHTQRIALYKSYPLLLLFTVHRAVQFEIYFLCGDMLII